MSNMMEGNRDNKSGPQRGEEDKANGGEMKPVKHKQSWHRQWGRGRKQKGDEGRRSKKRNREERRLEAPNPKSPACLLWAKSIPGLELPLNWWITSR